MGKTNANPENIDEVMVGYLLREGGDFLIIPEEEKLILNLLNPRDIRRMKQEIAAEFPNLDHTIDLSFETDVFPEALLQDDKELGQE